MNLWCLIPYLIYRYIPWRCNDGINIETSFHDKHLSELTPSVIGGFGTAENSDVAS